MRITSLEMYVNPVATSAGLDFDVTPDNGSDATLDFDVTPDNAAVQAAQPSALATQFAGYEVRVDDTKVRNGYIRSIDETLDYSNLIQSFGFDTVLTRPEGLFGSPFSCVGPALGKKRIDLLGVYRPGNKRYTVPIITDGIVTDSQFGDAGEGRNEKFPCVDRGGRFDGDPIDLVFPPGHGLPRGRVVRACMEKLGDTKTKLEDGGTMTKELAFVGAYPLDTLAEIMEIENRKLIRDPNGYLVNPKIGRPRPGEPVAFTFYPTDLLQIGGIHLDAKANVITRVEANGQQLVIDPECIVVTEVQDRIEKDFYAAKWTNYIQNTDGTYTAQSQPPDSTEKITIRRTLTETKRKCGTVIEVATRIWEWRNPQAARYEWDSASQAYKPLATYTNDNDAEFQPAYLYPQERFMLVSVEIVRYYYNFPGYDLGTPGAAITWRQEIADSWIGFDGSPYSAVFARRGQAQGTVTFSWSIYGPRGAKKQRDTAPYPLVPWEEVEPTDGARFYGSGDACATGNQAQLSISNANFPEISESSVNNEFESLVPTSLNVQAQYGTDRGYKVKDQEWQWGWTRKAGEGYLWGDEQQYASEVEIFNLDLVTTTNYEVDGNNTYKQSTQFRDANGQPKRGVSDTFESGLAGSLPSIERLDLPETNPDLYVDGQEMADLSQAAKRSQTKEISHVEDAPWLLTCHRPKTVKISLQWAENEEELKAACLFIIEDGAAMVLDFTLPANFFIRPTMLVRVVYPPRKIDHIVRVKSVSRGIGGSLPITTKVSAMLYGW